MSCSMRYTSVRTPRLSLLVERIDQKPVINLGGYTKGARNDVFAARPCPVQLQLMGYAGTLGAGM